MDNTYHRLDAVLTHTMDPDLVSRLGWEGEVTTSLGYSFERNRMTNWAIDDLVPRHAHPEELRSHHEAVCLTRQRANLALIPHSPSVRRAGSDRSALVRRRE